MKVIKIIVLVILISYILLACTKSNDFSNTISINNSQSTTATFPNGTWEGQYKKSSRDSAVYFGFKLLDNGSLLLLNESHDIIGAGSWQLNDTLFNAYYIEYATQFSNSINGYAQNNPGKLYGKWQNNNNYQDGGNWDVDKVE